MTTQATAPAAQTVPNRVPSTSSADPSPDQNVLPCAVAAWRPMATTALATPAPAAISSSVRARASNAAAGAAGAPAARSAGRQASSITASRPRPSAMAPYCTPRVTAKATEVTGPAFWSPSSSATPAAGGAASAPTAKTKPPLIGCESAETTL